MPVRGDRPRAERAARITAFALFLLLSALVMPGSAYGGAIVKKQVRGHIVNGGAYGAPIPWQVGLVPVGADGAIKVPFEVFCGGTIRDATHIITAAHCVPDSSAAEIAVVANLNNLSDGVNAGAQVRLVSAITSHPLFRGVDTGNDLAILTLTQALPTAVPTWPITNPNVNWVGAQAVISGWGLLFDRGPSPDALQAAVIQVLSDQQCSGYAEGFSPATMLCAGLPNGPLTVDTCQGDSGGPLVFNSVPAFPLIGIVSFGRGCADPNFPGIYTRLSNPDLNARAKAATPPPRTEPVGGTTVQGTPTVGQTLTCDPGQWTLPATFTFSWRSAKLSADGKPTDVKGEGPGPTLALIAAHADRAVGCQATATTTNDGGTRESGAKPVLVTAAAAAAATPAPVALPQDLLAPTSRFTRRACARRRCSLTITASDSGGAATGATVTYQRLTGCRKGRRGARCRKAKRLKVASRSPGVFTVRTPKLAPASYRFTVIATDASGNRSEPTSVVLRVRR